MIGNTFKVISPPATSEAVSYPIREWPLPPDFPIVIDRGGRVVSRYQDPVWNFSSFAGRAVSLNFGDHLSSRQEVALSPRSASMMRRWAAWFIYKRRPSIGVSSLVNSAAKLRRIFKACDRYEIDPTEISAHPKVIDDVFKACTASVAIGLFSVLAEMKYAEDEIGYSLLTNDRLRQVEALLPRHYVQQVAYIPPRIWLYQANRLKEFLDDYLIYADAIDRLFKSCVGVYIDKYGSIAESCQMGRSSNNPFQTEDKVSKFGYFDDKAKEYGVYELFMKWIGIVSGPYGGKRLSVSAFSKYFRLAQFVGCGYIISFSGMRVSEFARLRCDCIRREKDPRFGRITLLKGETYKTVEDDDALWVTSPSVEIAVSVLSKVAKLRAWVARQDNRVPITDAELENPYFMMRCYEPWSSFVGAREIELDIVKALSPYSDWRTCSEKLFDENQLRITESDLEIARLINPTLDPDKFFIGTEWTLSWHQLRRTMAVNMTSSGLVSDSSLQYLLKHARRAMSLYYGQGYSHLNLNKSAKIEYIRTTYEILGKQISELFSDRYTSPYGKQRKDSILNGIDPTDHGKLLKKAMKGQIFYRETLLGGCVKKGPCEFGGIDNIAHCGGGFDEGYCPDALFDRKKESTVRDLAKVIEEGLVGAPHGSPLRASLEAQLKSAKNVLAAISSDDWI